MEIDSYRVLVVEDDDSQAFSTRHLPQLTRAKFEMERVPCLAEAVRKIRELQPHCLVLDLELADVSSLEGLLYLTRTFPDMPIVVLAAGNEAALEVEVIRQGAQDCIRKDGADEVMLERSIRFAIERKRLDAACRHLSLHDPLTGLPNRTVLFDRLEVALSRSKRTGGMVAVIFLDLDRFKRTNDARGHLVGDELLRSVARRLSSTLRPEDTIARFGGDEFVIVCENVDSLQHACDIAERLLLGLREGFEVSGTWLSMSASVGLALSTNGNGDPEELLREGDEAMYRVKLSGGNGISLSPRPQ
jgi:diguanylate cyclase (GGDEF)-like protein